MGEIPRCKSSGVVVMDPTACTGCGTCELVCSSRDTSVAHPALSCITLRYDPWEGAAGCDICLQCEYPACLYACPQGAIAEDEVTGARYIDPMRCKGCGTCFRACPLTPERPVIKFRTVEGRRKYFKCDLCRGQEGGPRCVRYCPTGALRLIAAPERMRGNRKPLQTSESG